jgi:hypothetical protein
MGKRKKKVGKEEIVGKQETEKERRKGKRMKEKNFLRDAV